MAVYFITGSTGFIGRYLLERLLKRVDPATDEIYALVREGSASKLQRALADHEKSAAVKIVFSDLRQPLLGIDDETVTRLRGKVDHFFHLAASYDMTADEQTIRELNVEGTQAAVDLSNALGSKIFHLVSSVAIAGEYKGTFTEEMFDEGQRFTHPYHETKFESEKLVREEVEGAWRVYRPGVVVGHSRTGVIDKLDGPYYFFKLIQRVRRFVPERLPLIGIESGMTNIVPVDYVADAIDFIAHKPRLNGRAFHIANPKPQKNGEVINEFAKAAGAPQFAMRIDNSITQKLPRRLLSLVRHIPGGNEIRRAVLGEFGIPDEVVEHMHMEPVFDTTQTARALKGSGIAPPALDTYAKAVWDYWEQHLDPDLYNDISLHTAVNGRTVIITGASSGIGKAAALKIAAAGGIPLLVARGVEKLEETKELIEQRGGTAYSYPCDLSDGEAIDNLLTHIFSDHPAVDYLVNNAGRSIRRSISLSYDRFHDFERLIDVNYLGAAKLIIGLLPHMRERKSGHIVNISSIGVQTSPPRFSAYVASKAALDAFTRVVSSETIGENVTFTTIHMPLVRTPMIAPTKMYDAFPAITPEEAADLICEAIRRRPKQINTRLGTFGEVAYALAPKAVDQILYLAYKVFPDSAAAKGEVDKGERVSNEARAMARLTRGVHW